MDVATLIDGNPAIGAPRNPHFKEMFQYAEIFHLKFLATCGFTFAISHPFLPAMSKSSTQSLI